MDWLDWFTWGKLYLLTEWVIRLVMLVYVPRKRSSAATRTWLLLIFLLPLVGILLYIVFGRIQLPKRRIEMQRLASQRIRDFAHYLGRPDLLPPVPDYLIPSCQLATKLGDFPPTFGNALEYLTDYQGAIDALIRDIDKAQHHVHLLYYIYGDDPVAQKVTDALARAAHRGVECRVLVDSVGSHDALQNVGPELADAGVEWVEVMPVGLFRTKAARFDLRNHRKIAVIDGRIGHIGSQNIIAPDFVSGHPHKELVVRITGPIVAQLQAVFLTDHFIETGRGTAPEPYFPKPEATGEVEAQILPSGPAYPRENHLNLLVSLVHAARKSIILVTPYFVPDAIFLHALIGACDRGVEVDMVVPMHPDQKISHWAQESHYEELLEAGVRIHRYRLGFLHAKHLTIDGAIAVIGSTNIDIRSFALNAEASLLLYDAPSISLLAEINRRTIADAEPVVLAEWRKRPLWKQTVENTARMADSLL